ncbi:MAG: Hint domain-containing protein [Tateyamaria sp.]|uniref:Hint domain-containing protein n=1 Tax=Tateyamaria sp. TaxID=1929288 RepID=UPI00329BAF24
MAAHEFTLRGDQIGSFSNASGQGNNDDRVLTLKDVTALGSSSDVFTIRVQQVNGGVTEFSNGQFITILDSDGNVVAGPTGVQPDDEQGLAAGDEHLVIRNAKLVIDVGGLNEGPETVQYAHEDEVANASAGDNDGELDFADTTTEFEDAGAAFPCFTRTTLIRTPFGERAVEDLKPGDLISTLDGDPQPIVWTRSRISHFQTRDDHDLPVLIPAGSIAKDQPKRDLVVSAQHCVLVQSANEATYLAPAKGLLGGKIRIQRGRKSVEYYSLLLPSHQVIWANGCLCESTYPGDYLMRNLLDTYASEIFTHFPLLRLGARIGYGPRRRTCLTVRQSKALAKSWQQSGKPLNGSQRQSNLVDATLLSAQSPQAANLVLSKPRSGASCLPLRSSD